MGMNNQSDNRLTGIIYGGAAYILWGILPVYWKLLKSIPSDQILAHRIIWSCVFAFGLVAVSGNMVKVRETLANRKNLFYTVLCAILISANWFIYIWSVNSNHLVQASMGYYINPLMSILLGLTVLKERLNGLQYTALFMAAAGVVIMTVQYGNVPWISLTLAATFALYGLFKKLASTDSKVGLALETAILIPVAIIYLICKQVEGVGAIGSIPVHTVVIMLCSGVITATPLLWFAKAAKQVELATIGFLQYFSPTISLILGVFLFKEPFTKQNAISFGFIWCALALYSVSQMVTLRRNRIVAAVQRN